jgi:hypothetical protein
MVWFSRTRRVLQWNPKQLKVKHPKKVSNRKVARTLQRVIYNGPNIDVMKKFLFLSFGEHFNAGLDEGSQYIDR